MLIILLFVFILLLSLHKFTWYLFIFIYVDATVYYLIVSKGKQTTAFTHFIFIYYTMLFYCIIIIINNIVTYLWYRYLISPKHYYYLFIDCRCNCIIYVHCLNKRWKDTFKIAFIFVIQYFNFTNFYVNTLLFPILMVDSALTSGVGGHHHERRPSETLLSTAFLSSL